MLRIVRLLGVGPRYPDLNPEPARWHGRIPGTAQEWREFGEAGAEVLIGCVVNDMLGDLPGLTFTFVPTVGVFEPWEAYVLEGEWDWYHLTYLKYFGPPDEINTDLSVVPDPPTLVNGVWVRSGEGSQFMEGIDFSTFLEFVRIVHAEQNRLRRHWDDAATVRGMVMACLSEGKKVAVPPQGCGDQVQDGRQQHPDTPIGSPVHQAPGVPARDGSGPNV